MAEQIHHTLLPEDSEEEIQIGDLIYHAGEGKYYEPSARTLTAVSVSKGGLEYKGTPVIHSRIQGESTYSKDFGGVATDIEYVDGGVRPKGWEDQWTRTSWGGEPPTDEEKLKPIQTSVMSHPSPQASSFREAQWSRGSKSPTGHLLGWTSGSPPEIHYPLKGPDGELDYADVLAHEMSHKFLGHTQEVRSIEKRLQLLFQANIDDPEVIEFAEHIMTEFEVRLFQEAEGFPIDNRCRFDEFVRRTEKSSKRKGGRDFPAGMFDLLAIQALTNMEEEGVITEKTVRLYLQRLKIRSRTKRFSTGKVYDPDEAYFEESEDSEYYEDYQEALRQQDLRYRRIGPEGRWTK